LSTADAYVQGPPSPRPAQSRLSSIVCSSYNGAEIASVPLAGPKPPLSQSGGLLTRRASLMPHVRCVVARRSSKSGTIAALRAAAGRHRGDAVHSRAAAALRCCRRAESGRCTASDDDVARLGTAAAAERGAATQAAGCSRRARWGLGVAERARASAAASEQLMKAPHPCPPCLSTTTSHRTPARCTPRSRLLFSQQLSHRTSPPSSPSRCLALLRR
jgi:hypothetical protein